MSRDSSQQMIMMFSPTSRLSPAEKSSLLVTAIRDRVGVNPDNYHIVVSHMRRQNVRRYSDIIRILDKEYRSVSDPSAANPLPGIHLQVKGENIGK